MTVSNSAKGACCTPGFNLVDTVDTVRIPGKRVPACGLDSP